MDLDEFDSEDGAGFAAAPRRAAPGAFARLESEGALVAAMLAVVAVAYGALLLTSWHESNGPLPAPLVATRPALVESSLAATPPIKLAAAVAAPDRRAEVQPRAAPISAVTLNSIWRQSDTRSLQQAFAHLRHDTLAFHRCSMQMTAKDRAVARCEGVESRAAVHWTLDFQRTGNRWAIQRVSNR